MTDAFDAADFTLALIASRRSVAPRRLVVPGPDANQLRRLVAAAALRERDPAADAASLAEARAKAQRAPELLLAVLRLAPRHDDVVDAERYVTLGAALMNLLLAAHAMGFGATLTSGRAPRSAAFARAAGLADDERPVCLVSLGTPTAARRRPRASVDTLLQDWAPRPLQPTPPRPK